MSYLHLVPETTVHANGVGSAIEVEGGMLNITLAISEILEQESLDVQIHASPDGVTWSPKPVLSFPQKFYKGLTSMMLDLSRYPEIRYLQARWKVNRWGRGEPKPMFTFLVAAEAVAIRPS